MPTNVTDSDAFTDPVKVPNNTEAANQASLLDNFVQALSNRTRYLFNRLGHGARYTMSGSGITPGSKYTLTLVERSTTAYVLASDEVTVPEAGWYLLAVAAAVANSDTSNPLGVIARLKAGSTIIVDGVALRFNAVAGDSVGCSASALVQITTPSSQKITVVNGSGAGNHTVSGSVQNALSIQRIA